MAEPSLSSFILVGALTTAAGPILGPLALIVFGAVSGSMLSMSEASTKTVWEGFKFVTVGILLSISITEMAALVLEKLFGLPEIYVLMPIAAVIGANRIQILDLTRSSLSKLGTKLSSFIDKIGG